MDDPKNIDMPATHRGNGLAPSTPESFNYETKYIVLNFMSMIPERYSSLTHTPLTSTSESDPFIKEISASRSLPSSPPKHTHRKFFSKRQPNRLPPQASEDNVGHRYQLETKKYLKQVSDGSDENELSGESLHKYSITHELPEDDAMLEHNTRGRESLYMSQYRHITMINREDSEISTYSNCSNYTSDADDEFEETSNTSSALSSLNWSVNKNRASSKGDNIDIRHVLSRLPTVPSESDIENDSLSGQLLPEGTDFIGKFSVIDSPSPIDVSDVKLDVVGSEEVLGDIDVVESRSISIDIAHSSITTPSLDRSQLRLDIRDQSEWQCEENRKLELLLAEMRTEIQDEIISFESEIEDAIKKHIIDPIESPFSAPESPQTAAARVLARIGDEVKDHYEQRLQEALGRLFPDQQQGYFNYDNFRRIANDVIDENLPGWRQVALILLYGQNVAWRAVENGVRGIGNFVDYTTRLIEDSAADFIIQQGGWRAVMNFDPSQSSESPLSPESLEDIPSIDEDQLQFSMEKNDFNDRKCNCSHSNNNTFKQRRFEFYPYTADPEPDEEFDEMSENIVVEQQNLTVHTKKFETSDYIHIFIFLIQFVAFALHNSRSLK